MVDRLIVTSNTRGFHQLGVHGQPVVMAYRQLAAILASRLSADHAAFLALPRLDPAGQRVDWYTALDGPVQRVTDLSAEAAASLRAAASAKAADIAALAQSLIAADGAGELVGRMLSFALTVPGGDHLYSVGGKPVLILWGHQTEAGAILDADPLKAGGDRATSAPSAAPIDPRQPALERRPARTEAAIGPSRPSGEASSPSHPATSPEARAQPAAGAASPQGDAFADPRGAGGEDRIVRRGFWGWFFWLIPLLLILLVIFLGFKACTPLAPRVVDVPDPARPAAPLDPSADLAARIKALQDERNRLADEQKAIIGQCTPDDPVPPKRAEDLPPTPKPPVAEPAPVEPSKPAPKLAVPEAPAARAPAPVTPPSAPPIAPPSHPAPKAEATPSCKPNFAPGDEPEVVMIVDGSGSMNEPFGGGASRIEQARRSIATVVEGLPPGIDVGLVDFRGCDNVRRDKFYSDAERGQFFNEINNLSPWGGTPLARSIERAGNIVSSDVDSVIVIVSDGEESCRGDPCAAARALKAAKPKSVINVIDISGDAKGRAVIQCVANATGGQVLKPNSPLDLKNKLQQATRQPDMRACRK